MTLHDEYDILGIYNGAFATVYKARHKSLGYVRAIKELKDAIFSEDDKAYKTFIKECRVLMQIGNGNCPNIVKMYSPRLLGNHAVVEMDFVEGPTLTKYLCQNHFMPIAEVMRLIKEIGGALAYCHHDIYKFLMKPTEDYLKCDPNDATKYVIDAQQERDLIKKYRVVHNDIHSGNVMRRDHDGSFLLLDFGLAIQNGHAVKSSSRNQGAYEYKAPEKWDMALSADVPPQCDIYSFGVLLFEALTGRVPFELDTNKFINELAAQNEMRRLHCNAPVPAIEPLRRQAFLKAHPGQLWEKDYPDWLEQMVLKCLSKKPSDRYADAYELMEDFNRHIEQEKNTDSTQVAKLQQQLLEAQQQLKKERKTNENLSNENKRLSLRNKELREKLNKADYNEENTPWGWMIAICVLLGTTLGLLFSDTSGRDRLSYLNSLMPWYSTDTISTLQPTATIDTTWVEHNQALTDGNGMTINLKLKINHMRGRKMDVIAYFYDENGNPLKDRNNLYTSGNYVSTRTTITPTDETETFDDVKLSIPYGEFHLRVYTPQILRYKICLVDRQTNQKFYVEIGRAHV